MRQVSAIKPGLEPEVPVAPPEMVGLLDAFRLTRAYRDSSAEERQRLERYIRELDLSPGSA